MKLAERVATRPLGPEPMEVSGADVSGALAMVNSREAVPVFPASSDALTENVGGPAASAVY